MKYKIALLFAASVAALAAAPLAQAKPFKWASAGEISTWDIHSQNNALQNGIHAAVYESLVYYNSRNFKIEPVLATSWNLVSPTQLRVNLRQGVKFHDGSPFTADDAAYSIERVRFRGSRFVGLGIFLAYLVPPSILFIPLATMIFKMGLYDSPLALILTYPTFLIPFCTWLLMGYFRSIPFELEECALIDGASRWQILVKIVLPLAVPGLISAGIFAFTLSWNEFIYALTFISSSEMKTLPVGVVTELVQGDVYQWGPLMAGALLGSLPVAFIYSFFVEYYVSGMTGSVKE